PDSNPDVLPGSAIDPNHLALHAPSGQGVDRPARWLIGDVYGPTCHLDDIHGAAIAEGKLVDTFRVDYLGNIVRAASDQRRGRSHVDGFVDFTHIERGVQFQDLTRRHGDAGPQVTAEPFLLNRQHIGTNGEVGNRVKTR